MMLTLWGGGHFDGHVWRRIIVPPDLGNDLRKLSLLCVYFVILHVHSCMIEVNVRKATYPERNCSAGLTTKKS